MTMPTTLPHLPASPPDPGRPGRPVVLPGSPPREAPATPEILRVVPWEDPLVDATGVDVQSAYVEIFWLPMLGPSATWLLRRLAEGLWRAPTGYDLDLEQAARSLGLGGVGSGRSPFRRAMARCTRYGTARHVAPRVLAVRRRLATVPERALLRLPPSLQEQHRRWAATARSGADLATARRRARALALDMATVEPEPAALEQRLLRWGVHPALAFESAEWAMARLRHPAGTRPDPWPERP